MARDTLEELESELRQDDNYRAWDIVREVAIMKPNPINEDGLWHCVFCDEYGKVDGDHYPGCIWILARALVEGE